MRSTMARMGRGLRLGCVIRNRVSFLFPAVVLIISFFEEKYVRERESRLVEAKERR